MEKCDQTLSKYLRDNRDMPISLKMDLAIQMSEGLAYLHRNQWCHQDIKPSNILLKIMDDSDKKIIVKLTDVGLVKGISDSSSQLSSKLDYAAMAWVAPELYATPFQFKKPSDVWAFGCVIYYSLTVGRHPFDNRVGRTLADRATNIIKNNVNLSALENQETTDREVKKELVYWITKMVSKEQTERPKAKEIVIFLRLLDNKMKNLAEKEIIIIDQLSKEENNQTIGKIGYSDTKFLYRSSSSCVYLGSFTTDINQRRIPCAVKIVAKDKTTTSVEQIKRNELNLLIKLPRELTQSIVQYYGFEENANCW